jgi:superfamily II DNA or RNA helicase
LTDHIQPGDWIAGPFWEASVQVITRRERSDHDLVAVNAPHLERSRAYVLTPDDWTQVQRVARADYRDVGFTGDPTRFRLAIDAHRLRLAHSIDPYAALNASRIDPLPHQFEAVYERLLARPVMRALLAHDAGAGKTIMAGLVIKELQRRQAVRRVLIVAPAGLTIQWRRELLTKFGLDVTIVDRDYMRQEGLDSLDVWRETDAAITSIAFARQKGLRRALESVEWDLVVVDEAHKMAAYRRPNGSVRKTQAYELGEVLSRHTAHFLLMTATPHKGDPENYRLLLRLLDADWSRASAHVDGANPMVLRRTKEEMRKPNGEPLYPERIVETEHYTISHEEGELLERVHKFIRKRYDRAQSANQQNAAFALLTLERRMASSPYALRESLRRIRGKIADRLAGQEVPQSTDGADGDWTDWEELSEQERWEREAQAEAEAAAIVSRRQLKRELRQVDALIERADALVQRGDQAKLQALMDACQVWVDDHGEQLIVFTEFKDTLDDLVARLEAEGYTTTQIHGRMAVEERRAAERAFWDAEAQILVATEAAGEGINLQCCSVMVNYDIPWNPCRLEQRMGRIHRYGQEAPQVHIFNLVATNTMEGQVKQALLEKMDAMRMDLGDKVFDVVGQALWEDEGLPGTLERIALGDGAAVDQARQIVERAGEAARQAKEAEDRAASAEPLDLERFRRKRATFAAHRLSPEESEAFFRQAVGFVGGALEEFDVEGEDGVTYLAFEVTLPPDLRGDDHPRTLRLSFWPPACSDDETAEDAVLFIAPGHWLFEALLDRVIERCRPDLNQGAVFCDLQPEDDAAYLVWFVRSRIRDGLDRRVGDLLAAVQHRPDQETVTPLPDEVLDGFDSGAGEAVDEEARRVRPMLAAQEEVVSQCVESAFLPELADHRERRREALARDRRFLTQGLTGLAAHWNDAALEAFGEGEVDLGSELTDRATAAQQCLDDLEDQLERAGHLLLTAPEVLGVALVLPTPLEVEIEGEDGPERVLMRRDEEVEDAAMEAVMRYEARQGRHPRDVHVGNSWDVESDDEQGRVARYIEVKGRGPEDADVVTMTGPEWEAARRLGDRHWLYIVLLGDGMLVMIQNPYAKLAPRELKRWIVKVKDAAGQGVAVQLEGEDA